MKKRSLPKEILVYVCDELEDGTPVYAVANNVKEIPEDADGQLIGVYYLNTTPKFKVRRELT